MSDPRAQLDLAEATLGMALEAIRHARAALQTAPGAPATQEAALTVEEAATALRVRPATVRVMCQEGRLPGAFKPAGAKAWLIPSTALPSANSSAAPTNPVTDLDAHRLAARVLKGAK